MFLFLYLFLCRDGIINYDIRLNDYNKFFFLKCTKFIVCMYMYNNKYFIEMVCRILDVSKNKDKCIIGIFFVYI